MRIRAMSTLASFLRLLQLNSFSSIRLKLLFSSLLQLE